MGSGAVASETFALTRPPAILRNKPARPVVEKGGTTQAKNGRNHCRFSSAIGENNGIDRICPGASASGLGHGRHRRVHRMNLNRPKLSYATPRARVAADFAALSVPHTETNGKILFRTSWRSRLPKAREPAHLIARARNYPVARVASCRGFQSPSHFKPPFSSYLWTPFPPRNP